MKTKARDQSNSSANGFDATVELHHPFVFHFMYPCKAAQRADKLSRSTPSFSTRLAVYPSGGDFFVDSSCRSFETLNAPLVGLGARSIVMTSPSMLR